MNKCCALQTLPHSASGNIRQWQCIDKISALLPNLQGRQQERISHRSECAGQDKSSAGMALGHIWDSAVLQP